MEENEIGAGNGGNEGQNPKPHQLIGCDGKPLTVEVEGQEKDNNEPANRGWKAARAVCRFIWSGIRNLNLWQALAALALVFVGFAQISVYNRQAVIMRAQAQISKDQQSDTRAIQRAFLAPIRYDELTISSTDPSVNWGWRVGADVKNSGMTPAHAVSIRAEMCFREKALPNNSLFPDPGEPVEPLTYIFPEQPLTMAPMDISTLHVAMVNAGAYHLYYWGEIQYKDIFKYPHTTRFCVQLKKVEGDYLHTKTSNTAKWSWIACPGPYACSDDDCRPTAPHIPEICPEETVNISNEDMRRFLKPDVIRSLDAGKLPGIPAD